MRSGFVPVADFWAIAGEVILANLGRALLSIQPS
jgi:hypothetical protein